MKRVMILLVTGAAISGIAAVAASARNDALPSAAPGGIVAGD